MALSSPSTEVDLFFSYSHSDERLRDDLAKHLKLLERQHFIRSWHDRRIGAGDEWSHAIDEHLHGAGIILLLISADFLASDYCFDVEMKAALKMHDKGEAIVIPVILRPVDWHSSPFGKLEALPKDGKPVTTFDNQDAAYAEIATGIRKAIETLSERPVTHQPQPKTKLALLPVTASSPLVLGLAIDVSGSMQTSIGSERGPDQNRLQAVLNSLKSIAGASAQSSPEAGLNAISRVVRIFSYGFGFTDRAADFGKIASFARQFLSSIPSAPSRVYRGGVRDLLEMTGLGNRSVLLRDLGAQWQQVESRLWEQRFDLFGDTPMQEALVKVRRRFEQEFASYPGVPRSALIIISDGESTDGSPVEECTAIAGSGTTIIGDYLTSGDISAPRKLYSSLPAGWPGGAKTLFEISSVIGEDGMVLGTLHSKGWDATPASRLFIQLNQSEIMADFVAAVLETQAGAEHNT